MKKDSDTIIPSRFRNNNPGNIRLTNITWLGKVPNALNTGKGFEQFTELKYGIRAMIKDLTNKIKSGRNTIRAIISMYAPPTDGNQTEAYIKFVSLQTGFLPNQPLKPTLEAIKKLCTAMTHIETGHPVTEAEFMEGWG